MKIEELTPDIDNDLTNVNVSDDLHFFMHNDPKFYRLYFYPVLASLRDSLKASKQCKTSVFRPVVEKAISVYFKKFNIPGDQNSIFTDVDRDALARRIFDEEVSNVQQGAYAPTEVNEDISAAQLHQVERFADALWQQYGVDIEFTRHFLDRVNDARNNQPITADELIALFKKEFLVHGRDIADFDSNGQAVMKDLLTKINIPFVVVDKGKERDLVMKTVMRKPNFRTPNKEFKV